jgi:beta-lactamase regulating signal transducer with metallopeptidase domain
MLDLALRTSAILLAAGGACVMLRRASAATRHLVLHAAVVAVLLAPLLLPLTPTFDVPLLPALRDGFARLAPPVTDSSRQLPEQDRVTAATPTAASRDVAAPIQAAPHSMWASVATIVWVTGSVLCAMWFALGWIRVARIVRRAFPVEPSWHIELNDVCARLRIRGEVGLLLVPGNTTPVVTGLFRPSILLPARAREWDADRRRSVLFHELAHVQRGDCRVQALAQAACALYWFSPLMWMTFARLRAERERACDDRVLQSGLTPSVYAGHLLEIARDLERGLQPSAALAAARPSEIEGRLVAVLAQGRARVPTVWARAIVLTMITIVTGASLGASTSALPVTSPGVHRAGSAQRFMVPLDAPPPDERPTARAAAAQASRTLELSGDSKVRERAVLDLIASDQDAAIDPLRSALDDPSQDIREKAALGLALRSGSDVIPALLKALGDSDSQVREKAALGLAMRRDDRATDALLATANDPDSQVREKVAMALGTSGDARATAALNQMLADEDSQVREKAAAGLMLLGRGAGTDADAETIRGGIRSMVTAFARLTQSR